MLKNYRITIEYDGTGFSGWQKQKKEKTVQGEIETVLRKILNQEIKTSASGRTDAGVHAFEQVANFRADTRISPLDLKAGINSLIKQPIVIRDCCLVEDDFHARYSAVSKEYHYFILNRHDPCAIGKSYQWHIRQPLDIDKMQQGCQAITGTFDFKSFESTGSPRPTSIRQVFFSTITPDENNRLVFKICANGFLRYMVRNLVGTLVLVGRNKISVDQFIKIRDAKDRTKAGPTAPAHGLFLIKVNYS